MLVLSRKLNERVVIEGGIEIMVVDIRGDKVRLGIVAPRHLAVHRKEVSLRIEAERSGRYDTADADKETASV